jgi:hypothetical protein
LALPKEPPNKALRERSIGDAKAKKTKTKKKPKWKRSDSLVVIAKNSTDEAQSVHSAEEEEGGRRRQ